MTAQNQGRYLPPTISRVIDMSRDPLRAFAVSSPRLSTRLYEIIIYSA